jgi:hypothetical protein
MIPNLDQTLLFLLLGTPLLFILLLLPALLELRKPRDSGPRLIMDKLPEFYVQSRVAAIANIEEEVKFEFSIIPKLTKIVEVLPNLEV